MILWKYEGSLADMIDLSAIRLILQGKSMIQYCFKDRHIHHSVIYPRPIKHIWFKYGVWILPLFGIIYRCLSFVIGITLIVCWQSTSILSTYKAGVASSVVILWKEKMFYYPKSYRLTWNKLAKCIFTCISWSKQTKV